MLHYLALASGVLVHNCVFRHGEWDTRSPAVVLSYLGFALVGTVWFSTSPFTPNGAADVRILPSGFLWLMGYHLVGLYTSIILYRSLFHRLSSSKYPGPFLARLSNFYLTWLSAKALHLHDEIHMLHGKYGDYVRIGSRELSITDPEAVNIIYGSQSKTLKGPAYIYLEPRTTLSSTRDKSEHARRRKVWDRGFSTKALQSYEPMVSHVTDQLLHIMEERSGEPINITELIDYYAFEVMGNLAFGKPFNMLTDQKDAYFLNVIRKDMRLVGYLLNLPWLLYLFLRTPLLNRNHNHFWTWIGKELGERISRGAQRPDVFSWIHKAYLQSPQSKKDTLKLHGDGYLIVVAGSDTTFSTITHLLFYLACNRPLVVRLQQELDKLPDLSDENLRTVDLLEASINETLRLRPAVPGGLQRVTPKEGLWIGNRHIPGDVIVKMPLYTLFRDSRSFEHPNDFIPERWTTRPELVKNASVFIPFLTGSYACVGRRLALMEMRRVVATMLTRYDLGLAPAQTKEGFLDGKIDAFILFPAPLFLRVTKRSRPS